MVQGAGGEPQARPEAPDALARACACICVDRPAHAVAADTRGCVVTLGVSFCIAQQGFADRVFYESLLQQRPESKMARKWCLEFGVLKWAEAEALCKELGVAIVRIALRFLVSVSDELLTVQSLTLLGML